MTKKIPHLLLCLFVLLAIGIAGIAQQSATEAPAGFDTPTFTPAQSVRNGIPEPTGDTFALDQQTFEQRKDIHAGLGPGLQRDLVCRLSPESRNRWAQPDYRDEGWP
jgi:hypothetical protein